MIVRNREQAEALMTPHGSEIRPLLDRTTSAITRCSLAEEVLPPGCAVKVHRHRELEEIYYLLSGAGVMTIDRETRQVTAGDAVYIPRETPHSLANTGTEPIRLLLICGPAYYPADEIIDDEL